MIECREKPDAGLDLDMFVPIDSPSIYMDHGAIGVILDDPGRTREFVATSQRARATLCFSWIGLSEFARNSQLTAARGDALLEQLYPSLFFIEVNPWHVIEREDALLAGGPAIAPHGDLEFLKLLLSLPARPAQGLTTRGTIMGIGEIKSANMNVLGDILVRQVTQLREEVAADPQLQKRAKLALPGPAGIRGTRVLVRELLMTFLRDPSIRLTRNHGIDFYHAVVPAAYATHVVLDRHWATQTSQAVIRLRKIGYDPGYAEVHSGNAPGLEELMRSLT